MYKTIAILSLAAVGMVGCANNKKMASIPTSESITDISAPAPAFAVTPAPQPIAPVAQIASFEAAPTAGPSANGGSYTVKKGDTLYGIARSHYGDGKAWNKIVAANPGLSPQSLKVGKTIMVP